MSPIKGLSEARRVPRLGKIRLGIKVTKQREDKSEYTYPSATDYFVCPAELLKALGLKEDAKPITLDIMFPTEQETDFAPQWYRCYSMTRGLVCKGDGEFCSRMVDEKGDLANRDSKQVVWKDNLPCDGKDCLYFKNKQCKTVMNLMFLLPSVPGLGVWQIDTGSVNSIININSGIDFIRKVCKRISYVPLTLSLEAQQVINPEDGKKKTVHVLTLRTKGTLPELMEASRQTARLYLAMPAPAVEEPPEDVEDTPANGEIAQEKPVQPKKGAAVPPNELSKAMQTGTPIVAPEPATKPAEDPAQASPVKTDSAPSILQGQKPLATAPQMRTINAHKARLGEDKFWNVAHTSGIQSIADLDTEQAKYLIEALSKAK